ncbi:MAG: hypothetical protein XXXJIFNMEKO3_00593 [Candidatus Erwinia impunctatus]|nr:hypothetical protein XXXJIFNMEKO_00593 [Culicoides impunctatus]
MIWRWFWREWKSPSLMIVWLALTLSVTCVLALGLINDRMAQGLSLQSRNVMAGDRTLQSAKEVPQAWLEKAQQGGLSVTRQLTFITMTYAGDTPKLASVKAVDEHYPLFGELVTAPSGVKPAPGTILVAPQLLSLLNVQTGDTLDVGDNTLRISGTLIQEPDAGFNPFQTAPRVLMNLADVGKTGAIQPGSRVTWRYKFAGTKAQLAPYDEFINQHLQPGQRWLSIDNEDNALGQSVQRAQQFLLMSALLTLILSVAAVAVAMSHYCRSRYDLVAVLKTLGAGRAALQKLIIGQWLVLLLLAAVAGGVLGTLFEAILLQLLKPVLPAILPDASGWPWVWALSALVIISLLVGLRPYRMLLATQPLRVLRRDTVANVWPLSVYIPLMLLVVVGLLVALVGSSRLLWIMIAALGLLALLLAGIGWLGLLLLRRLTVQSLALRLAINRLLRQPWATMSQLAAFSLSFMLLALLLAMRGDLLMRWQQQLPAESPNYFLLNLTDEQVPSMTSFLRQHQITPETFYPLIRARLPEINHRPADPNQDNALNRELNLTWQEKRPEHNPLTAGNWPPGQGEVSIEEALAGRLGVKLGDTLTFSGDTQQFTAKITSMREVDWESLRPNFFFIFPPGGLTGQPQSWLTSFHLPAGNEQVITALNRQFPTVSVLDIGAILGQINQIMTQVSRALEVMVVLVTGCGLLLLLAQIQVGMRQRRQELLVCRTLGAGKKLLYRTLWCEFALIGALAGAMAALGAEVALWALARYVFNLPWMPDIRLWISLPVIGALLLSTCGGVLGVRLLKGASLTRQSNAL